MKVKKCDKTGGRTTQVEFRKQAVDDDILIFHEHLKFLGPDSLQNNNASLGRFSSVLTSS